MYPIVNLSGWKYEDLMVSGSKEKRWYRMPGSNKLVLFKLPITLTSESSNNMSEITGEMWSEKLASDIAEILGFNVHQVDIASLEIDQEAISFYGLDEDKIRCLDIIYGALCHSFLSEGLESLVEGADLIMELDDTYNRKLLKGNKEVYSYQLLLRVFDKYNCIDDLYKMIIFDTLIGNTDRHQDNFGMIRDEVSSRSLSFAPFYDNSSSLGRELTTQRIQLMFRDKQMFQSYLFGKKSSPQIKWGDINQNTKLNFFDFLNRVKLLTPEIKKYDVVVAKLTDIKIDKIIDAIPEIVMSKLHKEFVNKLLKLRRDITLEELSK
ncbi:HipA domain-containing protein [Paenibacillus medicaginis]|uniref:HipA domain-containing protein n=1 Tax=Paenibacillus medicaginis TaxID=1470560 RepID=A0ABV5C0W6_9BACL